MIAYDMMKPYIYENEAISKDVKLPYLMYVPESYDPAKKYKVLFFMHGMGERGSNHKHLGDEGYCRYLCYVLEDPKLREEFILVAPQCEESTTWVKIEAMVNYLDAKEFPGTALSPALALVYDLLESKLAKDYNIDGSRIYMAGLSMGAMATWYTVIHKPKLLAAAVPVCGGGDPKDMHKAKNVPIWAFHSLDDNIVPHQCLLVAKEVMERENAPDFHATMYEHEGHGSWVRAFGEREVFEWMISKVNPDPEIK